MDHFYDQGVFVENGYNHLELLVIVYLMFDDVLPNDPKLIQGLFAKQLDIGWQTLILKASIEIPEEVLQQKKQFEENILLGLNKFTSEELKILPNKVKEVLIDMIRKRK